MCRGTHSTSVQAVGINRWRYLNYKFSSGPFWTHKIKTKAKYISISNVLHLLSTPVSIPHVEAVLASLVVESPSNCKFSIISDFCLIVDLCFHPSRALTRSLESFTPLTWMYFCYDQLLYPTTPRWLIPQVPFHHPQKHVNLTIGVSTTRVVLEHPDKSRVEAEGAGDAPNHGHMLRSPNIDPE